MAVGFQGGDVLLMRGYDDCIPQVIVNSNAEAAHLIRSRRGGIFQGAFRELERLGVQQDLIPETDIQILALCAFWDMKKYPLNCMFSM